jgi:hypothetical protein
MHIHHQVRLPSLLRLHLVVAVDVDAEQLNPLLFLSR